LLRQGTPKLPLTWMDATIADCIVTARRRKAVEINAAGTTRSAWQGVQCALLVCGGRVLLRMRSLATEHPEYKAHHFGDLRARDAAYHQRTV
jgi:Amylo-alpha-1,6-glucosidase